MNTNTCHVLLVDDNPADLDLVRFALEETGLPHSLAVAQDGAEALGYLRREGAHREARRPDLIFLDVKLPKKDGKQVLEEIRRDERLKDLLVVMLSSSDAPGDVTRSYELGADAYLFKPRSLDDTISLISSATRFWLSPVSRTQSHVSAGTVHTTDPAISVLLVEDSDADADMVLDALEKSTNPRFTSARAMSLSGAFKKMETGPFDVVLLDLGLPDTSGLETIARFRRQAGDMPVVVLSGRDEEEAQRDALRRGAQDYLVKSASFPSGRRLIRTIEHAIVRNQQVQTLSRTKDALERLSTTDPHTGLLNRRGFVNLLQRKIEESPPTGIWGAAILLDLDDLREINKTVGHAAGDVVLREAARRMSERVRDHGYAARIGGDEFVALLPGIDGAKARAFADQVREAIAGAPIKFGGKEIRVTPSMSVAPLGPDVRSVEDLFLRTDLFLQQSKRAGKNRVTVDPCCGAFDVQKSLEQPEQMVALIEQLRAAAAMALEMMPMEKARRLLADQAANLEDYLKQHFHLEDEACKRLLAMNVPGLSPLASTIMNEHAQILARLSAARQGPGAHDAEGFKNALLDVLVQLAEHEIGEALLLRWLRNHGNEGGAQA
ncbi:MAG: response regulator [Bdellovibrionota bacterium]